MEGVGTAISTLKSHVTHIAARRYLSDSETPLNSVLSKKES